MKVFTIESGTVREGATVERLALKGASVTIPAILVGEEGRGRHRGVLPVSFTPSLQKEWEEKGRVIVLFAEHGQSQAGKPKLLARDTVGSEEKILVVFRTKIGFRGGNSHSGDRTREVKKDYLGNELPVFAPFPGEIIAQGMIAQGDAGGMGSGQQLVAVMPKGVWFRTGYSGRLYGAPSAHYYRWDGEKILALTWEERQLLETLAPEPESEKLKELPAQAPSEIAQTESTVPSTKTAVTVENFSRHPLSADQTSALKQMFGEDVKVGEPKAPFFKDASDFASQVFGKTASVVAPADFLLEAQADGLLTEGTVLLFWRADEESRKRGNHAIRALLRFVLTDGRWSKTVVTVEPTVEVSFKDGTTYVYGGEPL